MIALSNSLRDELLTFDCPHCGHTLIRKGSWFKSVSRFTCAGCQRQAPMTYNTKIRVFAMHAHLARRPANPSVSTASRHGSPSAELPLPP